MDDCDCPLPVRLPLPFPFAYPHSPLVIDSSDNPSSIVSLRKSAAFVALFGFLSITFLLLAVGEFGPHPLVAKAGGAFGIVTAFIAYYIGLSELLASEKKAVAHLPLVPF